MATQDYIGRVGPLQRVGGVLGPQLDTLFAAVPTPPAEEPAVEECEDGFDWEHRAAIAAAAPQLLRLAGQYQTSGGDAAKGGPAFRSTLIWLPAQPHAMLHSKPLCATVFLRDTYKETVSSDMPATRARTNVTAVSESSHRRAQVTRPRHGELSTSICRIRFDAVQGSSPPPRALWQRSCPSSKELLHLDAQRHFCRNPRSFACIHKFCVLRLQDVQLVSLHQLTWTHLVTRAVQG
ncbi:hypothetical protein BKA62DRAFT_834347 [Auriculariales sp. MPI-PUGE-AT-0066]|nr:hypothetical protein BKA62DRAFT_834347 [Auriculariales sp. MPI-PUGE-AT-0066]